MDLLLEEIKKPISKELANFESYFKSITESKTALLNQIINYLLKRKGKQIRPMLVFLSARLTGNISDATYVAAGLIELLHTASLIHDDIVDESLVRRGFLSINAIWKSKVAVLIGDFLLAKGMLLAVDKNEFDLLKIVSEAVKDMSEGELLQIQKSRSSDIDEDAYFQIIRKKTAALIAACTQCGGKSAGADDEMIKRMKILGENIGIAFQIKDDLFDFEDANIIGKPFGNDLKEKKLTLPLIYSLQNSSRDEKRKIKKLIYQESQKEFNFRSIKNFVSSKGGLEYAKIKMNEYKEEALKTLYFFPDNEARLSLINLVEYSVRRNK
jgi:octaprenyl-diphosphate synthase